MSEAAVSNPLLKSACRDDDKRRSEGFIACITTEGMIELFGEGDTPESALSNFVDGGGLSDHCGNEDLKVGSSVLVRVFEGIYPNTKNPISDDFDDDWQWMLGREISRHEIPVI